MPHEVRAISLPLPYHLGKVNCYLVEADTGYVLIDTGGSNGRAELDRELQSAGCKPGTLGLIVLTHGDFDHSGNAAHLRQKYAARVVMHHHDSGMVERGDMFSNRKKPNLLLRTLIPVLSGFGKTERFTPDAYVEDRCDLSEYGFRARVLHIPGHSKGSIGILTASGELFCGDLLENTAGPALNSIMDDRAAANASVAILESAGVSTVYPGHGKPFPMELFTSKPR